MLCISSDLHTILRIVCLPHCPSFVRTAGGVPTECRWGGHGRGDCATHLLANELPAYKHPLHTPDPRVRVLYRSSYAPPTNNPPPNITCDIGGGLGGGVGVHLLIPAHIYNNSLRAYIYVLAPPHPPPIALMAAWVSYSHA